MIFKSYQIREKFEIINNCKGILIYGENLGLKNDIKEFFKIRYKQSEIITFFQDEIIKNKDILLKEILNTSLFNPEKTIIVFEVSEKILSVVNEVIEQNVKNFKIILFAGELEKRSKLRNLFEKEDKLAIVACYNDTEITLRNYVASMLKGFKNLDSETINLIIENSNKDRNIIKNEIEKIKNCFPEKEIKNQELPELLNFKEIKDFDEMRHVTFTGNKEKLGELLSYAKFSSEDVMYYLTAMTNRLKKMKETLEIDETVGNIENSINLLKIKVFWKDKPNFVNEVRRFDKKKIDKTLEKLRDLEILIKTQPKINSGVVLKDFLVNFCNLQSNASLKA